MQVEDICQLSCCITSVFFLHSLTIQGSLWRNIKLLHVSDIPSMVFILHRKASMKTELHRVFHYEIFISNIVQNHSLTRGSYWGLSKYNSFLSHWKGGCLQLKYNSVLSKENKRIVLFESKMWLFFFLFLVLP